jgi:primosomal replication protein N
MEAPNRERRYTPVGIAIWVCVLHLQVEMKATDDNCGQAANIQMPFVMSLSKTNLFCIGDRAPVMLG